MKAFFLKTALIASTVSFLTACGDTNMRFLTSDVDSFKSETPADGWIPSVDPTPLPEVPPVVEAPPVVDVPAPTPTPAAPVVPAPAPVEPVPPVAKDDCEINGLSVKACYLMKIMELGCPLRDRVPAGYKAPSRAQIIANLNRCDATAYPTTSPTSAQLNMIQRLIDAKDASFRKHIFTGLYYKAPYTDDFKKYFGVELYNAEFVFCDQRGVPPGSGSIMPPTSDDAPVVLSKEYKAANVYAGQLNQCVSDSKAH